jgi:hypothetical protein
MWLACMRPTAGGIVDRGASGESLWRRRRMRKI